MNYIKPSAITTDMLIHKPNGIPIVLCSPAPRAVKKLTETGYFDLNLNEKLSENLLVYQKEDRPKRVADALRGFLSGLSHPTLISNFEMLFDPRYKLDVLKVFCEAALTQNIAIRWCGVSAEASLSYSEPQYPDYHKYEIERYTLICVK